MPVTVTSSVTLHAGVRDCCLQTTQSAIYMYISLFIYRARLMPENSGNR